MTKTRVTGVGGIFFKSDDPDSTSGTSNISESIERLTARAQHSSGGMPKTPTKKA